MLSSYESLNHCALETLYNRRHNEKRTCIYVSSTDINETNEIQKTQGFYEDTYYQKIEENINKNNSRSNLNRIEITDAYQQKPQKTEKNVFASLERGGNRNNAEEENDDDRKQKELSDWYYIKTSSKPKSTSYIKNLSPYVRRKVMLTNNNLSNNSSSANNIYHHHHHGSAKNLDEDENVVVTRDNNNKKSNNYVPVPAVRKFPPKSPVSYARKCHHHHINRQKQQTTCSSLTARIGEITSSSFEHVPSAITNNNNTSNAFTFQSEIVPEKQFSNNSLDVKAIRIHQQQQQQLHNNSTDDSTTKFRDARRRPLPLIPNIPPPSSTPPPIIQRVAEEQQQQQEVRVCIYLFQFVFLSSSSSSSIENALDFNVHLYIF